MTNDILRCRAERPFDRRREPFRPHTGSIEIRIVRAVELEHELRYYSSQPRSSKSSERNS